MDRITMGFFSSVLLLSSVTGRTSAQDASAAPAVAASSEAPTQDKRLTYDLYRRDQLKRAVPRTRNALIGTSVAFGVGLALLIPVWAGNHCVSYYDGNNDYYRSCDTTGKVLTGIGSPLAWGGSLGMIVSGIMLGVRKGKIRRLDERIMLTSERKLQWDLSTSRLVF